MNLADYLSELLGQHDEVSLPGLGYFVRERISGRYDDRDAKFYPPHHKVKFVPQPKEDDTFTQYVADKKNISLASSKYFTEKFISKLKEEALKGKYIFADLGLFQTDQDQQLIFKPYERIADDPAFYGYPPVDIDKLEQPLNGSQTKPVFTETKTVPVSTPKPIEANEQPLYFEEETEEKRGINIWLIVLIVIGMAALTVFGICKFYPAAFDKMSATYHKLTGQQVAVSPVIHHEAKIDTVKKTIAATDTTVKTIIPAAQTADTVNHSRFEVIAEKYRHLERANVEVIRLRSAGLGAKILLDAPGPFIKISVGTYPTYAAADSARLALIKAGKISKHTDEPLEIKPPK
jgi:nucleoid DNA-binding protein